MAEPKEATRHFESISDVLALLDQEVQADEMRNLFPRLEGIDYLWTAGGYLIPSIASPFVSPYLYRGQVKRYCPCVPGVFRGLDLVDHPQSLRPSDRTRLFADRIRLEEFVIALDAHPASGYSREIGLLMNQHAIAQHYELATDRIDLTEDHTVAAFFATNSRKGGVWFPVNEGVGVLYRLQRSAFARHMEANLECIGKQALPRPGEQKAYTLKLPLGCDFESLPIEIYTFRQDEVFGRALHERFDGGATLFPPDVMAEVADAIKAATSLSLDIASKLLDAELPEALRSHSLIDFMFALENQNIHLEARQPIVMDAAQHARAVEAVEGMRADFLKGVGMLAVRKVKPDDLPI